MSALARGFLLSIVLMPVRSLLRGVGHESNVNHRRDARTAPSMGWGHYPDGFHIDFAPAHFLWIAATPLVLPQKPLRRSTLYGDRPSLQFCSYRNCLSSLYSVAASIPLGSSGIVPRPNPFAEGRQDLEAHCGYANGNSTKENRHAS